MDFEAFGKIPRLINLPMVITEKIDGTNAQICIEDDEKTIRFGSRSRWVSVGSDNYGFAAWGEKNKDELLKLGPGRHFGEWWGKGIQRNYGLDEKRFTLFNSGRWSNPETRPPCVSCVPVLYYGKFDQEVVEAVKEGLRKNGSKVAPGFINPEGVVIYLPKAHLLFKSTLDNDLGKWVEGTIIYQGVNTGVIGGEI